ncbi:MAG: hypothetical protein HOP23_07990 [Methylococcaceae bacterium]|nr:hypothetical protein [Methylococcaceae bacterium]
MNKSQLIRKGLLGLVGLFFSATVWAHGGAAGTDTDQCKFELEPGHWIHYTAYQPNAFPAEDFCANVPNTNEMTILVFDYQDMKYRDDNVEFEVTKEPEGTQVYFLPMAKHKKGTVELKLPQGVPEAGKYLIHITLVPDKGERLDVHMGFKAGSGQTVSKNSLFLYVLAALAGLYALYLSSAGFKQKVDDTIKKIMS